jgi:16S rRNA processing protein RimM
MASEPAAKTIAAGRVGRAHGLDGSFYVTQPVPRLLALQAPVTVAGHARTIVRRAGTESRPILRLEGMSCREDAEALRGATLSFAVEQAPALGQGEFWSHELEGCAVCGQDGPLGTVHRLIGLPSCEALEVKLSAGGELLVPMVADAIRAVDIASRRIEIDVEFLGQP